MQRNRTAPRMSTIQAPPAPRWVLVTIALVVGLPLIRSWAPVVWDAYTQTDTIVVLETPFLVAASEPVIHIPWIPEVMRPKLGPIAAACLRHEVDPDLCAIIVLMESGSNPNAVSTAGATGIMQIMPATAVGIEEQRQKVVQLDNALVNLDNGAWLLSEELRRFGLPEDQDPGWNRTVTLAAAAYNGGPLAAARLDYESLTKGGDCASHYPSAEEEMWRYACFVSGMWRERHWEISPTFEAWLVYGQALLDAAVAAEAARQ